MPKRITKSTLYCRCLHSVFGSGIVAQQRVSNSGKLLADCVFGNGASRWTILESCLLVFAEQRTASLSERKAIKRMLIDLEPQEPATNWRDEVKGSDYPEPDTIQTTDSPDLELTESA